MRPYEGLLTAMVTPFHADGRVNDDASVAIAKHLLAHGSHGLEGMGVAGAQGLETHVVAQDLGERPRAEVQPVPSGRQHPVRAVQHGKTLTSATKGRD